MKRATVRDLRYDFTKVERLLQQGEEIEITKRNKVIGRLVPVKRVEPPRPDVMARLKKIYGDKVLKVSGAELLAWERDRY